MIIKCNNNIQSRNLLLIQLKRKYLKKAKMIINWKMSKLINQLRLQFQVSDIAEESEETTHPNNTSGQQDNDDQQRFTAFIFKSK